jgi:hypothetical protein
MVPKFLPFRQIVMPTVTWVARRENRETLTPIPSLSLQMHDDVVEQIMSHIEDLKPGAHVAWNTSQGQTKGTVLRKATCRIAIEGFELAATPGDPAYVVKSEKTGKLAAHKRKALRLLPN